MEFKNHYSKNLIELAYAVRIGEYRSRFLFLLVTMDRGKKITQPIFPQYRSHAGLRTFPPRPGRRVVFLGKTLYSHSASLHPGV